MAREVVAEVHTVDILMLHLLGRCNLECAHCYMDGSLRRQDRLPIDSVLRALGECQSLGIKNISLTGGEPLLYPELNRVLDAAAAVPKVQVTLCTNGTLITPRRVARFREVGLQLSVSIDGREDFHDRFRKSPGAFAATESGIRAAVAMGIPVTVISSISQQNLDAVEFLVDWAARLGADRFFAQPLLDLGRGKLIADTCLTFSEMNRLIFRTLGSSQPAEISTCHLSGHWRQEEISGRTSLRSVRPQWDRLSPRGLKGNQEARRSGGRDGAA